MISAAIIRFLECLPDALVLVDDHGTIRYATALAETTFGYGRGALLGRSVEELVPFDARDRHVNERSAYAKRPTIRPMGAQRNLKGLKKDGRSFPVEIRLSPIDFEGSPCVLAVARDVTEQMRFQEEARLRAVAASAAASGIAITDVNGKFVWVNEAFTRLTGYTSAEAVGQYPRILKSGLHPDSFYRDLWTTVLRGDIWQGETINRRKDGSLYTEEQTIAPVRSDDGALTHFVAIKQDITARREAEAALLESVRELELLDTLSRLGGSGLSPDDLLARSAPLIREGLALENVRFVLAPGGGGEEGPVHTITRRGPEVELPMRVADRRLGTMFASFPPDVRGRNERERVLVTVAGQLGTAIERTHLFAQLETLALTDALTNVHNRRSLMAQLEQEVSHCRRYDRPLSVLMIDIDHFKSVNDVHGHAVGDDVLRELTRRIGQKLRKMDPMGRYGGEEFVVILPDTDLVGASNMAERIRSAIAEEPFSTPSGPCRVTISIGVASIREDVTDNIEVLLGRADRALYGAKTSGRDRIVTAEG